MEPLSFPEFVQLIAPLKGRCTLEIPLVYGPDGKLDPDATVEDWEPFDTFLVFYESLATFPLASIKWAVRRGLKGKFNASIEELEAWAAEHRAAMAAALREQEKEEAEAQWPEPAQPKPDALDPSHPDYIVPWESIQVTEYIDELRCPAVHYTMPFPVNCPRSCRRYLDNLRHYGVMGRGGQPAAPATATASRPGSRPMVPVTSALDMLGHLL